jgi:hypothetical protein
VHARGQGVHFDYYNTSVPTGTIQMHPPPTEEQLVKLLHQVFMFYAHTHTHTHTHTHKHTHTQTHIHTLCVCIYMYVYVYIHIYI